MRIAILTMYFPPRWLAGIELATYNIASELAKAGHDVHIVTTKDPDLPPKSRENGFTVHRIPYETRIPLLSVGSFFLKVKGAIKEIDPDVLHIQNLLWGWMGASIYRSYGIPYVVNGHGDDIYTDSRLKAPAIRYGVKYAGAAVALTSHMKERIETICNKEACIIPNGVRLEPFKNPRDTRNEMDVPEDSKLITFVGGLRPVKGVQYLIDAMPRILSERKDALLLIIGDGEERDALEKRARDLGLANNVRFLGKVDNSLVADFLCASDVFVLPSLSEGFPLVILEAMAAGLPIICSAVGGTPDVIKDGRNGFLVQPMNSEEIAQRVLLILQSKEMSDAMSIANLTDVREFTWDHVARRFEDIYLNLISSRTSTQTSAAPRIMESKQ